MHITAPITGAALVGTFELTPIGVAPSLCPETPETFTITVNPTLTADPISD